MTGSPDFDRVNSPGQPSHTGFFLPLFFLQPGPVPAPDRPGPRSTHRAGPGFKTIQKTTTSYFYQNGFKSGKKKCNAHQILLGFTYELVKKPIFRNDDRCHKSVVSYLFFLFKREAARRNMRSTSSKDGESTSTPVGISTSFPDVTPFFEPRDIWLSVCFN